MPSSPLPLRPGLCTPSCSLAVNGSRSSELLVLGLRGLSVALEKQYQYQRAATARARAVAAALRSPIRKAANAKAIRKPPNRAMIRRGSVMPKGGLVRQQESRCMIPIAMIKKREKKGSRWLGLADVRRWPWYSAVCKQPQVRGYVMGDQTNKLKSSAPQNSQCGYVIGRARRPAARESPKARFPQAPYQGRGWYPAHVKDRACLPSRA